LPVGDLMLHRAYEWEKTVPDRVFFTQPMGGGVVRDLTWKQVMDEARRMATHLKSLDLPPRSQIALFAKNNAWWIMADVAIWMAGHVSVPLYPTLTPETIRQILVHSEAKLIFIGKLDGWDDMKGGIPDGMPRIALPLAPKGVGAAGAASNVDSWEAIVAKTEPMKESTRRDPAEMATIIYTSGSTGVPKGAMMSFGAMSAAADAIISHSTITHNDRMLSYLPLAHAMERWFVETVSLVSSMHIFFAESLDTFVADLRRARPTLFISVPRLWQKFQSGVFSKMPPAKLARMMRIPILSWVVRRKILKGLGLEHVRVAGSGSAPIPKDLLQWYRDLGLELLEGYGMTENFSYSHASVRGEARVGYVGSTYPGVHCRISPEGEVQVKSPGQMMGYFKEPELSAGCMTDDGYLKTGDRGEVDEKGRLRLTGRVKELFKTSKGKYVAPVPIENQLQVHPAVESVCVAGNGQPQPHALVMLSEDARKRAANGDDAVRKELAAALSDHLDQVNKGLDPHEQVEFLAVVKEVWSVDNGFLTPTLKLKRAAIEARYGAGMTGWYERREKVLWLE
jgi:long-chain acyl-CoA synthetase